MFKFDEICELIRLVGTTKVGSFEIEHGGTRLRIEGQAAAPVAAEAGAGGPSVALGPYVQQHAVAPQGTGAEKTPAPPATAEAAEDDGAHFVTSPIVGTFYRAPNPDAEPFVKIGDYVEKGQVLCIVEAMKLMNEIESDVSGTVVRAVAENAQPVEFGQRLFAIRPN